MQAFIFFATSRVRTKRLSISTCSANSGSVSTCSSHSSKGWTGRKIAHTRKPTSTWSQSKSPTASRSRSFLPSPFRPIQKLIYPQVSFRYFAEHRLDLSTSAVGTHETVIPAKRSGTEVPGHNVLTTTIAEDKKYRPCPKCQFVPSVRDVPANQQDQEAEL